MDESSPTEHPDLRVSHNDSLRNSLANTSMVSYKRRQSKRDRKNNRGIQLLPGVLDWLLKPKKSRLLVLEIPADMISVSGVKRSFDGLRYGNPCCLTRRVR